jgi:hypothetical protein
VFVQKEYHAQRAQELAANLSVSRILSLLKKLGVAGQVCRNQSMQLLVCLPKVISSNLALILQVLDSCWGIIGKIT